MKTIGRPVNPFSKEIVEEDLSQLFNRPIFKSGHYKEWLAWEKGAEAMENYYREALQPPLDLLLSAGVEVEKLLGGAFGNLLQVLTLIGIDEETEKERQAANKQEMSK